MTMTVDQILEKLEGVRKSGAGWTAKCPAHPDRNASLSIAKGEDQDVLLTCFAGCSFDDVMEALGVKGAGEPEAIYRYTDEDGNELFQAVRFPSKQFRYRHMVDGEWVWSMEGVRRVPYLLPCINKKGDASTIYITEGEKDAEAITFGKPRKPATCNPMGAGKWRAEYNEFFRDRNVVIVADKDKPGRDHARDVYKQLLPVAKQVWIVEAKEGKDASDHLEAGWGVADFVVWPEADCVQRHYRPLDLFVPVPEVDWVVEDIVVGGEATLLIADGGSGKSYFALAMGLAVAAGEPFLGCQVDQGKVMYVDEEGSPDLALQRFAELGATDEQKHNFDYLNFVGVDIVRHPRKLIEEALLVRPRLVVIDSHAKVTRTGEENSNNEMGKAWDDGFLPLARETKAAVLVIHHTNGYGSSRGASQIRNSADQVLTMERQSDGSQRVYASKPRRMTKSIHFRFNQIGHGRYELTEAESVFQGSEW